MNSLPGPSEILVSSAHGNAAISDADHPVTIVHHSQGAVLTPWLPDSSLEQPDAAQTAALVGKVHFPLPTLRAPEEETLRGSLVTGCAMVSTALEITVAPSPHAEKTQPPDRPPMVTRAEIFAGRKSLWWTGKGNDNGDDDMADYERQQGPLPTGQDSRIHVETVIYGEEDIGMRFNENSQGLGLTLTVQFGGKATGLMVSSVALVQTIQGRIPQD